MKSMKTAPADFEPAGAVFLMLFTKGTIYIIYLTNELLEDIIKADTERPFQRRFVTKVLVQ